MYTIDISNKKMQQEKIRIYLKIYLKSGQLENQLALKLHHPVKYLTYQRQKTLYTEKMP